MDAAASAPSAGVILDIASDEKSDSPMASISDTLDDGVENVIVPKIRLHGKQSPSGSKSTTSEASTSPTTDAICLEEKEPDKDKLSEIESHLIAEVSISYIYPLALTLIRNAR